MNRSKKYMMVAALATLSCGAMAQGLNTGYFIDGYTFRHNLNPAYGNDQNYVSIPALGNIQVRTQGNFGLGDVLFDNPRYGIDSDKKKTTFMNPYIADGEALKGFASATIASMPTWTLRCSLRASRPGAATTPSRSMPAPT